MPPTLVYTSLRLAMFVATLAVCASVNALLGGALPVLAVVAIAALASGLASIWLLAAQRRAMSASLGARVQRLGSRFDAGARSEDGAEGSGQDQSHAQRDGVGQL